MRTVDTPGKQPQFKDHFSGHAARYAAARPTYPNDLFDWLAEASPARDCAWDCATGNGQAARSLATHFTRVVATDASAEQIAAAGEAQGVAFRVAPAEDSGFADSSVDLITVAQALHWFDVAAFFDEAERVLRPGGILAYWCYGKCTVADDCDRIIADFYHAVDEYWPPEREIVEAGYRTIEPPLPEVAAPPFRMRIEWSVAEMLAYLATWSACQRARRATGSDPLAAYEPPLRAAWGGGPRAVTWPLHLTVVRAPAEAK